MDNTLTHQQVAAMPLWQMLDLALTDMKKFEAMPDCRVKMGSWLDQNRETCVGCLAGSVMRCTFNMKDFVDDSLNLSDDEAQALDEWSDVVDFLRRGSVNFALERLGRDNVLGVRDRRHVNYETNRDQWWAQMNQLLSELKAVNL